MKRMLHYWRDSAFILKFSVSVSNSSFKTINRCNHIVKTSQCMSNYKVYFNVSFNPLNAELNPICCLLALLEAHHFLHVTRIRVKSLTLRLLMSYIYIYIYIYIYMEHLFLMFLDHTQLRTTVGRTPLDE